MDPLQAGLDGERLPVFLDCFEIPALPSKGIRLSPYTR